MEKRHHPSIHRPLSQVSLLAAHRWEEKKAAEKRHSRQPQRRRGARRRDWRRWFFRWPRVSFSGGTLGSILSAVLYEIFLLGRGNSVALDLCAAFYWRWRRWRAIRRRATQRTCRAVRCGTRGTPAVLLIKGRYIQKAFFVPQKRKIERREYFVYTRVCSM